MNARTISVRPILCAHTRQIRNVDAQRVGRQQRDFLTAQIEILDENIGQIQMNAHRGNMHIGHRHVLQRRSENGIDNGLHFLDSAFGEPEFQSRRRWISSSSSYHIQSRQEENEKEDPAAWQHDDA